MHSAISSHQSAGSDRDAACVLHACAALKALYLVSGAAAQLGAHGLQIQDAQWQALAHATRDANAVLAAHQDSKPDAVEAFRRLSALCDRLLEGRATGHAYSSTAWRDLARADRDAYEQLNA